MSKIQKMIDDGRYYFPADPRWGVVEAELQELIADNQTKSHHIVERDRADTELLAAFRRWNGQLSVSATVALEDAFERWAGDGCKAGGGK